MYYVYFLKSKKKLNWSYVGMTNNVDRRIQEHTTGQSTYTSSYLPVYLVSYIAVKTHCQAEALENISSQVPGLHL